LEEAQVAGADIVKPAGDNNVVGHRGGQSRRTVR
jgi:hypothetical protein